MQITHSQCIRNEQTQYGTEQLFPWEREGGDNMAEL